MLACPSPVDLSSRTLRFPTGRLRRRRQRTGTRRRCLPAPRQALPALARPRCGDTYAQLAAGFAIATACRSLREAVDVPAALAPTPAEAMRVARATALVIPEGTLLPIGRIAAGTPYPSGKHKRHGRNVQVLTDPFGRLLRAWPALPGSPHDPTAARAPGSVGALAATGLTCRADRACQGADGPVGVPFRGRRLKRGPRRRHGTHAQIRCLGERAMATPTGRRLLRKLRCGTHRTTAIVQAVLLLHHAAA
ncbi:transposase family protein [Streptomyces sp. TLI_105]|uniref:transposase family protein n=1 Tax=Streptomyces sp. TLI_105 TaxID=1881019 RepID=UPI0008977A8D|nr:transposase family protein [Streptomyces sp. TLI_105]SEE09492.1 DDE superfamily endonuclease [Streptomyces sp. TLI_105]